MGKNKNQNRERSQASDSAATPGQGKADAAMETQNDAMPSMSPNISRKKGKKFGHN